jgi:hypothetical protein
MITAVYWEDLGFTPEDQFSYPELLYSVPQSVQTNVSIQPRQLPTISIPVHYSSFTLPNSTVTELMTALLNHKQRSEEHTSELQSPR